MKLCEINEAIDNNIDATVYHVAYIAPVSFEKFLSEEDLAEWSNTEFGERSNPDELYGGVVNYIGKQFSSHPQFLEFLIAQPDELWIKALLDQSKALYEVRIENIRIIDKSYEGRHTSGSYVGLPTLSYICDTNLHDFMRSNDWSESDIEAVVSNGTFKIIRHLGNRFIEDKMSMINVRRTLQGKSPQWIAAVKRLPKLLQKEVLDERPNPEQEDIDWVSSWKLASNKPVRIRMVNLLRNKDNLEAIARCPTDVVQEINRRWQLQVKPGKVYDQTPERYMKYAKEFSGNTAKPSGMVNGEIVFGVGRFIAALIRGDKQLMVWDIRT